MIDTAALREIPEWVCTRTGDELTQYCHEQGCALGYYPAETVAPLLDEIERLREQVREDLDVLRSHVSEIDRLRAKLDAAKAERCTDTACECCDLILVELDD